MAPPYSGPRQREIIKYEPPPAMLPLVTIAEKERTVVNAMISPTVSMTRHPTQPTWPMLHPSRRKRITPMMLSRHGTTTPFSVPSAFRWTSPSAPGWERCGRTRQSLSVSLSRSFFLSFFLSFILFSLSPFLSPNQLKRGQSHPLPLNPFPSLPFHNNAPPTCRHPEGRPQTRA